MLHRRSDLARQRAGDGNARDADEQQARQRPQGNGEGRTVDCSFHFCGALLEQSAFFLLHLAEDAPKVIHEFLALSGLHKLRHRFNFSRPAHLDLPLG